MYPPSEAAVLRLKRKLERKKDEASVEQEQRQAKQKGTIGVDTGLEEVQRRLRGKQKRPVEQVTTRSNKRKIEEVRATESEAEQEEEGKRKATSKSTTNSMDGTGPCSHSQGGAERRISTKNSGSCERKRKISDIKVERSKTMEDEAMKRILSTGKVPARAEGGSAEAEDETDNELIELCWQDLLKDNEGIAEENKAKRGRHQEPAFDADPKLPGDSNITGFIMTRLESRKSKRTTIDVHARTHGIHEGNRSKNFAVRTRGALSERECKVRKRIDDMHAIQRLLKRRTTTASPRGSRNGATGSGSSKAGRGGFKSEPP